MDAKATGGPIKAREARKRREREARASLILATAQTLFDERGYGETSLATIADRAGFAKSSVYRYFESKDEIFLTLLVDALDDLETELAGDLTAAEAPESGVGAVFDRLMHFLADRRSYHDVVVFLNSGDSPTALPKRLEKAWNEAIARNLDLLTDMFRDPGSGSARARDPVQEALILVALGLGIHALVQSRSDAIRDRLDRDALAEIVRQRVVPGLTGTSTNGGT